MTELITKGIGKKDLLMENSCVRIRQCVIITQHGNLQPPKPKTSH